MRKYAFITLLFFLCESTISQNISINSIKITNDNTSYNNNQLNKYFIEIVLRNQETVPVSFWLMKCGWFLSFVFNRKDILFEYNCISDISKVVTIYNNKEILFKGIILSKNKIDKEFLRKILVAFVFYDTSLFTKVGYQTAIFKKDGIAKKIHYRKQNQPDTIWYNQPIEFIDTHR
jgi:hypothetical protein